MAKRKKSKKSKAATGAKLPMTTTNQTGVLRNNIANVGIFPHDEFDAALRMYAHPAAVTDLDQLSHGGPAWKRFLEAFGNSVKDLAIMNYQPGFGSAESIFSSIFGVTRMVNQGCPLLSAFAVWKGQEFLMVIQNPTV